MKGGEISLCWSIPEMNDRMRKKKSWVLPSVMNE